MATKKADLPDGADSDGAALFSMEELRARLDAPLFHRDPGMNTPTQLPRLREHSSDHAVIEPTPEVAQPVVEAAPTRPARPMLVSFSDMLSSTRAQEAQPPAEAATDSPLEPPPSKIAATSPIVEAPAELAQPAAAPEPPAVAAVEPEASPAVVADVESTDPRPLADFPAPVAAPMPVQAPAEVPALIPAALTDVVAAHIVPELVAEPRSSVAAELDRLAFLPDHEEPVGRVIVPPIVHSEQREPVGVPVLSQHEMYTPRSIAAPSAKKNVFEAAFQATATTKKRKRAVVKRLFSLLVILAILGGGVYAAKYYLLATKWDPDVEVIAKEVEAARLLEFDHAVEVTTLTGDEYAMRIARYALGIKDSNEDQVAGQMRALGLLTGALDLRAIGLAALPEAPAFYDSRAEKIFVVDGLPAETYRFAMHRALATALLDQEYGWGGRTASSSPSVVRGTRALFDADAITTATSMLTPTDHPLVLEQRASLFTTFNVFATPTQFGTAVAGRLGVSMRAFIQSLPIAERDFFLKDVAISEAEALDLRRLVDGVIEDADGPRSEGMLFWYHVLASRLDVSTAWNSALALQRDDVSVAPGPNGFCVSAVLTVSLDALPGVEAAFVAWAAAAPAESTTVVSSGTDGNGQLSINACDPGIAVPTNNGVAPLTMGGAPLRSEQYRLLLTALPGLPNLQAVCAVYGSDSVSLADERWVIDGLEGWSAPAAHPLPDPNRPGCA